MNFSYQGFTNDRDRRYFTFRESAVQAVGVFSIEVDLPLLSRNRVPVQDGPMFCLSLLTAASLNGPLSLEKFRNYRVVEEDFRSLLVEREKRATEKAMKKTARKPPFRRPPTTSNIHLGPHPADSHQADSHPGSHQPNSNQPNSSLSDSHLPGQ